VRAAEAMHSMPIAASAGDIYHCRDDLSFDNGFAYSHLFNVSTSRACADKCAADAKCMAYVFRSNIPANISRDIEGCSLYRTLWQPTIQPLAYPACTGLRPHANSTFESAGHGSVVHADGSDLSGRTYSRRNLHGIHFCLMSRKAIRRRNQNTDGVSARVQAHRRSNRHAYAVVVILTYAEHNYNGVAFGTHMQTNTRPSTCIVLTRISLSSIDVETNRCTVPTAFDPVVCAVKPHGHPFWKRHDVI
jgi:hypothetical protein